MAAAKEILTRPVAATLRLRLLAGAEKQPIGPAFGPYRLNIKAFCNDFNARTQKYKPDTPIAVTVTAYKDNSYDFTVKSPSVSWFIRKAAGVAKGSTRPGHLTVTTLSVRHVYEIAKVKQTDPFCEYMPLESICKSIIGTAKSMGIKVVNDLE